MPPWVDLRGRITNPFSDGTKNIKQKYTDVHDGYIKRKCSLQWFGRCFDAQWR